MKRWLQFVWAWSWLPCVCFLAAFVVWAQHTLDYFVTFGLERDVRPLGVTLKDAGKRELDHMLRGIRLQLERRAVPEAEAALQLRSLQLFVASNDLARLDANLPYSGLDYVDGVLRLGVQEQQVKLRYRGDTMLHWANAKKSLRLKTRKDELFLGMRAFNLVVPKSQEQLNNYLSCRLAQLLGLITPKAELVNVFLNGRFHGLYVLLEQIDEGTLRAHDRMPGDIYSGEAVGLDAFTGVPNLLFGDAALWEKVAANNHYDLDSRVPLETLIRLLNTPADEVSMQALGELLDLDAFARLSVLEQLTQSHHDDQTHNWRLFWDPWRRKFEPIVWDIVGWHPSMRPPDGGPLDLHPVYSTLHAQLHKHAGFLVARARALHEFYGKGMDRQFLAELDRAVLQVQAPLAADANVEPPDDDAIAAGIAGFQAFVRDALRGIQKDMLEGAEGLQWRAPANAGEPLLLQIATARSIDQLQLEFQAPVQPARASLRLLRPEGSAAIDLGGRCRVQQDRVVIDLPLVSELAHVFYRRGEGLGIRNNRQQVHPTSYELQLEGVDLRTVKQVRGRDAGGEREFTANRELVPTLARDLFSAIPRAPGAELQLQGEIQVDGIRSIDAPVRIAAGTRFRLGPGAALLFHGRVRAEGTGPQPIEFVPAGRDQDPWGTVALDGPGCSGSLLSFCSFRGGSGHKQALAEYTAMFSVHNARDVTVTDCSFRDSKVTDDMIHVVYSQVTFARVLLERALMDALDCDISEVVVTHSRFLRSGNDGIDLMTTRAVVADCEFEGCGDKGISIGEDTRIAVIDCSFDRCQKAMEAKDGSIAAVLHADVLGCTTALNAYRKNWRYDAGGRLTVYRGRFSHNLQMPTADHASQVNLVDCQVDAPLDGKYEFDGRMAKNHATAVGCSDLPEAAAAEVPFPTGLEMLRAVAGPLWQQAAGGQRGWVRRDR